MNIKNLENLTINKMSSDLLSAVLEAATAYGSLFSFDMFGSSAALMQDRVALYLLNSSDDFPASLRRVLLRYPKDGACDCVLTSLGLSRDDIENTVIVSDWLPPVAAQCLIMAGMVSMSELNEHGIIPVMSMPCIYGLPDDLGYHLAYSDSDIFSRVVNMLKDPEWVLPDLKTANEILSFGEYFSISENGASRALLDVAGDRFYDVVLDPFPWFLPSVSSLPIHFGSPVVFFEKYDKSLELVDVIRSSSDIMLEFPVMVRLIREFKGTDGFASRMRAYRAGVSLEDLLV